MQLNFGPIFSHFDLLVKGEWLTLWLALLTSVLGFALSLVVGLAKHYGHFPLRWIATLYVEFWRNSPLLVQLYFAYFGLAEFGVNLSPITATILVFTFNAAGYMAEMVRGGLASVAHGQLEAAQSLALTRWQTFRHVVLPPALKTAAPSLGNQVILITLATSEASLISTPELSYQASILNSDFFRTFEVYIVILVMYFFTARLMILIFRAATQRLFRAPQATNIPTL